MTAALDIRALRMAQERIAKDQADLCANAFSAKIPDPETYRERFGQYRGLQRALAILEEIEKEIR